MYNEKNSILAIEKITLMLSAYSWSEVQTEAMWEQGLQALLFIRSELKKIRTDKSYCKSGDDDLRYVMFLNQAKKELSEGNLWNCCHELYDLFKIEPVRQERIVAALREFLNDVSTEE